ncbi:MAG TPA: hypothetical protein VGB70_12885 [Allosphingosinicella sp.]|jgi:hypothetical protein
MHKTDLNALASREEAATDKVLAEVAAERRRQTEVEGWTLEHDDAHADGQLARAAGCYALSGGGVETAMPKFKNGSALFWPWAKHWWKPKDRRSDLVRSAALAVAEIERIDRGASLRAIAAQGGE